MGCHKLLQKLIGLVLIALLLTTCGSPVPPTQAIVTGRVEKDGQPLANTEIKLVMTVEGSDGESRTTQTDANGQFTFEDVMPATYYLIASVVIEGKAQCSTTSPGFIILQVVAANKDTGAPITLAMATGSEEPFEVKAGDQITKDIVFRCK